MVRQLKAAIWDCARALWPLGTPGNPVVPGAARRPSTDISSGKEGSGEWLEQGSNHRPVQRAEEAVGLRYGKRSAIVAAGPNGGAELGHAGAEARPGADSWAPAGGGVLRFADLVLDLSRHEVSRGGEAIELTRTEFRLLELFLRNPGQVLTRELIFDRVWGFGYAVTSNTLNVYIGYLRRKIEPEGQPRLIYTVRGIGYVLRDEGRSSGASAG